ncbi:hypothetical protein [Mucilaginibacter humi]|nr:hypothetical protein [Mucilaginibacter humi]
MLLAEMNDFPDLLLFIKSFAALLDGFTDSGLLGIDTACLFQMDAV